MARSTERTRLGVVAMTIFLDLFGFGVIIPLLPSYAERYGATPFQVGLLSASYSLMQFLFVPLWGRLSDRVGRRSILLISIAGSALSFTLLGLARTLAALFAARLLSGLTTANLSVAQAYVADVTRPEDRARGMGMIGAAFGLGFVVGPAIGGLLSHVRIPLPFGGNIAAGTAPFFFSALLSALNWVVAWFLLPESLPAGPEAARSRLDLFSSRRLREALRRPGVGSMLLLYFMVTLAFSMMEATLVLFGEKRLHMTPMGGGLLFTYIGVLMVLVQGGMVGRLARRFGEARLLVAGTLMMVPGLLLVPLAHSYLFLGVTMLLLAGGSGIGHPCLNALLSRRSRADEQGGILGLNQSLGSLARVFGPALGGYVFGSLGIGFPYWLGGLVMAAAAALAVRAVRDKEIPLPGDGQRD